MGQWGKRLGIGAGALLLAAGVGFGVASQRAGARLAQTFKVHDVDIPVPYPLDASELDALRAERASAAPAIADAGIGEVPDPLAGVDLGAVALERAIARGKHLVEARYACNACHGENFAGGEMIDDGAIGVLRGPNITSGKGGRVAAYTISDWDHIVRHGIKPDGTPAVMPSDDFFEMSDRELSDVVAYLRSQPPVDGEEPAPSFGPVGKVLLAVGKFPVSAEAHPNHAGAHLATPPAAADSVEFGRHLAAICTGCHRQNLAGGPMTFGPPDWPAASNLTQHDAGLKGWSFAEFERAMAQGAAKDGRPLRPPMSLVVATVNAMTSTERRALWTYLTSLAPVPTNP